MGIAFLPQFLVLNCIVFFKCISYKHSSVIHPWIKTVIQTMVCIPGIWTNMVYVSFLLIQLLPEFSEAAQPCLTAGKALLCMQAYYYWSAAILQAHTVRPHWATLIWSKCKVQYKHFPPLISNMYTGSLPAVHIRSMHIIHISHAYQEPIFQYAHSPFYINRINECIYHTFTGLVSMKINPEKPSSDIPVLYMFDKQAYCSTGTTWLSMRTRRICKYLESFI